MKKTVAVLLAMLMATCMSAFALADTYTATARGYAGDVTVTLTIEDGILTAASAEGASETMGIGSNAIEKMPQAMVEQNSVEVDGISGATLTSEAVLAAAKAALEQSGATLTAVEKQQTVYEDTQTQVVIVGAGIAGMTAAMQLADQGIDVMLLEKTDVTGGAAISSHGGFWAVHADMTAEVYDFTSDEVYEFFSKQAAPVYSKDVFYAIADTSTEAYHFAVENGVPVSGVGPCNEKTDPRFYGFSVNGIGMGMMAALNAAMQSREIDVRTNTEVTGLVQSESGEITGVYAVCDGQTYTVSAEKVILATGGFGQNPEMLSVYASGAENLGTNFTFAGSTGDGHQMGVEVGGVLIGEGYMGYASTPQDMGNMTFGKPLTINSKGEKVSGADDHYTKLHEIIAEQDDQLVYVIFPADMKTIDGVGEPSEILEKYYNNGMLVKADTIEALAEQIGVDPATLRATVDKHNALCAEGKSDEFDTDLRYMMPIEQGPFYAHLRQTCIIGTITGLVVDADMKVLAEDGQPVENLYAIGELIYGNWFNGNYPMSGTGLAGCLSSGTIVAKTVSAALAD